MYNAVWLMWQHVLSDKRFYTVIYTIIIVWVGSVIGAHFAEASLSERHASSGWHQSIPSQQQWTTAEQLPNGWQRIWRAWVPPRASLPWEVTVQVRVTRRLQESGVQEGSPLS